MTLLSLKSAPRRSGGRQLRRGCTAAALSALLASSVFSSAALAASESAIRDYLAATSGTAYLQRGALRLERLEPDQRTPRNVVVFQKYINGVPLHGGKVTVIESAAGAIERVFDESTEGLVLNTGEPTIDAAGAEKRIDAALATGATSRRVWFRQGQQAIPAWEVTTSLADAGAPASPTGLETVVDAITGRILSQRQLDTKTYAPGSPETADGVFPRIVINDTIGAVGSRAYAAPFDAIVEVDFNCTGVLIAEDVVLSARHCNVGAGDTIVFGANANGGGIFQATVQSSILPDGFGSLLDGGDVVILPLTSAVPDSVATPMRLIDETNDLEGRVCATLGYGFNGVGSQGHNFSADGRRWGGENIIDEYGRPSGSFGSNIISTDFDDGSAGANQISGSSATPLEFEATTAPGDSGGPVLVQLGDEWLVAGVLSGGTTSTSVYGDVSWWTGTAVFRAEIEARGGVFFVDADEDGDGVADGMDNCLLEVNPDQIDADGDGFGNRCDADFTADCAVNFADLGYMKLAFFSPDPLADLDGDGVVNFSDLGLMKALFFGEPGPSGVVETCVPAR